jgi:hypothetical protein
VADLDKILSGNGASAPAPETAVEQVTQEAPETEPSTEQPEAEGTEATQGGQKMVPHEALHAEKQKVKRYTEEVADFRKQLQESNAAWDRRMAQFMEAVKPKKEQQTPPDFYENPVAATRHEVNGLVSPQFEQMTQALMANARLVAGVKYTDEKVDEAERAFIEAIQSNKIDPADYQKVLNSPNRYAAAVQWHQRKQAQEEIGDDPAAFRARLEAEILTKHGLTPQGQQQGQQPVANPTVMPSNLATARSVAPRSGPTWSGPTPLADIFSR